ncbi:MAG: hypothetical protein RBU23_06975 [Candidatus Auribacterota bacterium]|jgi:ribosomal protein S20|nr:hypothetical protein [Candidatus Auribacterota bacterium]
MSNIQSINYHDDYLQNAQQTLEQERKKEIRQENKDKSVQDVLDTALKNAIKRENLIAADQDVNSADEAASLLAEIMSKISTSPNADKIHIQFDTDRINALINN